MARNKAKWFPVNDGTPYKTKKGSHTPGKQKNMQCQRTPDKDLLCKARSYKHVAKYLRWDEIFGKI